MTLCELQNSFKKEASYLGDYNLLTKTELANGYCDAEEQEFKYDAEGNTKEAAKYNTLKSRYLSALMLRYWYKIFEWTSNSSSLALEQIEYVNWLYMGFEAAFYFKAWRDEYKAKYKFGKFVSWQLDENGNKIPNPYYYVIDPNAPDKIFNRCLFSVRGKKYQYYNKLKRKIEVRKESLDSMLSDVGDSVSLAPGGYCLPETDFGVNVLIKELLDRGEVIEAVIADKIINSECFITQTEKKKVYKGHNENAEPIVETVKNSCEVFSKRKLIKNLKEINESYLTEFCRIYNVKPKLQETLLEKISSMTSSRYYQILEKFQFEMRQNSQLLSTLVN